MIGFIDASKGDPILPFTHAARHGFEKTMDVLNLYDNYGDYQRLTAGKFSDFFKQELGLKTPGWHRIPNDSYVVTNGTTGGFSLIMKYIAREAARLNTLLELDEKPVIIVPVPTYGYFMIPAWEEKLTVVTVPRDPKNNWQVDPAMLDAKIAELNKTGHRVVAYFDSNPNNPTGRVRELEETAALGNVLYKHSVRTQDRLDKRRDALELERGRALPPGEEDPFDEIFNPPKTSAEKKKPSPRRVRIHMDRDVGDIQLIDDMVYHGTEYDGKKPVPFSLSEELYPQTFLLAGGSKIGLAALRAGVILCDRDKADELRRMVKHHQYFPSIPALHALEAQLSVEPEHVAARTAHLSEMNAQHRFSAKLFKALINGIDDADATPEEAQRMAEEVAKAMGISEDAANERLQRGVKDIDVVTTPESGFFHLVDMEKMRGRHYSTYHARNCAYVGTKECENESGITHVTEACGVKPCMGSFCGYDDKEQLMVRISCAEPPETIVAIANRLADAVDCFKIRKQDVEYESTPFQQQRDRERHQR